MKKLYLSIAAISLIYTAQAEAKDAAESQNPIFGVWETARVPEEGETKIAHIKIEPCRNNPKKVCGKLIWSEVKIDPETGKPPLDKNNKDESLQSRSIICIQTLKDLEPGDEPNTYKNGELYSSRTGKTYTGDVKVQDQDHLIVTGSVFGGLFSRSTTWTRVKNPEKDPCK